MHVLCCYCLAIIFFVPSQYNDFLCTVGKICLLDFRAFFSDRAQTTTRANLNPRRVSFGTTTRFFFDADNCIRLRVSDVFYDTIFVLNSMFGSISVAPSGNYL